VLDAVGYIIIIQSLEKNETLRLLNIISTTEANLQPIRDQLILSLPKMKSVQVLHVVTGLLDLDDRPGMMTAFRQNVSIVKVADHSYTPLSDDPRLKPILTRNKDLILLDSLLGTTVPTTTATTTTTAGTTATTTATTSSIPPFPRDGLWAPLLAAVGQGCEGGSPVFKILCNRLATWIVPKSSSGNTAGNGCGAAKKKHSRGDEDSQTISAKMRKKQE
jgi:hypothetical protein